jgi:hypothetical protein
MTTSERRTGAPEPPAAELFDQLWQELVTLLGTTATATLLRRALKHATVNSAESGFPVVTREGLEYAYAVPDFWRDPARRDAVECLRAIVAHHLQPLLRDLTGPVVTRHLARVSVLARAGLFSAEEVA